MALFSILEHCEMHAKLKIAIIVEINWKTRGLDLEFVMTIK